MIRARDARALFIFVLDWPNLLKPFSAHPSAPPLPVRWEIGRKRLRCSTQHNTRVCLYALAVPTKHTYRMDMCKLSVRSRSMHYSSASVCICIIYIKRYTLCAVITYAHLHARVLRLNLI